MITFTVSPAEYVILFVCAVTGVLALFSLMVWVLFLLPLRRRQGSVPDRPTPLTPEFEWTSQREREAAWRPRVQAIVRGNDQLREFLDYLDGDHPARLREFEAHNPTLMHKLRHYLLSDKEHHG